MNTSNFVCSVPRCLFLSYLEAPPNQTLTRMTLLLGSNHHNPLWPAEQGLQLPKAVSSSRSEKIVSEKLRIQPSLDLEKECGWFRVDFVRRCKWLCLFLGHIYTGAALLKTERSFLCILKISQHLHKQRKHCSMHAKPIVGGVTL